MAIKLSSPPQTYQEWMDCFVQMKQSNISDEHINLICKGTLQGNEQTSLRFQINIVNLLNDMLDARTTRFIKQMNVLLENNELFDLVELFRKFRKEIKHCLFFSRIDWLPSTFRQELFQSAEKQIRIFLKKITDHLEYQAFETSNLEMEDVLYQIKRIKFFEQ